MFFTTGSTASNTGLSGWNPQSFANQTIGTNLGGGGGWPSYQGPQPQWGPGPGGYSGGTPYGQIGVQSQIQPQNLFSPFATAQGMGGMFNQAWGQAANQGNVQSLRGFSMASPGLQQNANFAAGNLIGGANSQAQQLGLQNSAANAGNMLAGQQARFGDFSNQLQNAANWQNMMGQWGLGNTNLGVSANQAQQASNTNWLNMALQQRAGNFGNWANWLGNVGGLVGGDVAAQQTARNALLNQLQGVWNMQ